jgi:hypothetical protein
LVFVDGGGRRAAAAAVAMTVATAAVWDSKGRRRGYIDSDIARPIWLATQGMRVFFWFRLLFSSPSTAQYNSFLDRLGCFEQASAKWQT